MTEDEQAKGFKAVWLGHRVQCYHLLGFDWARNPRRRPGRAAQGSSYSWAL